MKAACFVLFFTSCVTDYTEDFEQVYQSDCATVVAYRPLNQGRVDMYFSNAKRRYESFFGLGSFCADIGEVLITVKTKSWTCENGGNCTGMTERPFRNITLADNGRSLLHEMFHVREFKYNIDPDQPNGHIHWKEKGYYAASDAFVAESIGFRLWTGWLDN